MIASFKLKNFIAFFMFLVAGLMCCVVIVSNAFTYSFGGLSHICIVLDAGHGGRDGGSTGISTGVAESDINLKIVKKLERQLKNVGFMVVLTRKDEKGLYDESASNKKKSDMEKRRQIIEKANPQLTISIHLNSYPDKNVRGAQVFYLKESLPSKAFADSIQEALIKFLVDAKKSANFGDYYLLKCTENPTVIVECGYLSNESEEMLLISDEYQEKIAYSILCGIIKYFKITPSVEVFG